jgi:putative sigma-54 modulation protein
MQLQISAKNMEISPEARRYIERKLGKLSHYLPYIGEAKVEVSQEKTRSPQEHFVVQVTVDNTGTPLRSQERGADLFTAIDKVSAVMNRRIEHYKSKRYHKRKSKKTTPPPQNDLIEEAEPASAQPQVVKVKSFTLKPMAVDEAIDQMEVLGHDFFLFFNADTEKLNLLYRRRDSNYGLIEPELG